MSKRVKRRKYYAPILQRLQKLDHHNILSAHLMLTVVDPPSGKQDSHLSINEAVHERPASWAYFTVGQFQEILTRIIQQPERDIFYFIFNRRRFRVKPYIELPDVKPKSKAKNTPTTEGLISEVIN